MRLISLKVHKSPSCGGLLDGMFVSFRDSFEPTRFSPLCLIGPNGSGKSQVLQIVAEIFQLIFRKYIPAAERGHTNDKLEFELVYQIEYEGQNCTVKFAHLATNAGKLEFRIERRDVTGWSQITDESEIITLLPERVISYTSGDNETLSIPFLASREAYSKKVEDASAYGETGVRMPPLMLIDYHTNLEVVVSNLLLNTREVRTELLEALNLGRLKSFRIVIKLKHSGKYKNGVPLTGELEECIEKLASCATASDIDREKKVYTLDYMASEALRQMFSEYWPDGPFDLYTSLHKLAMLNERMIKPSSRKAFYKSIKERKFEYRLTEPIAEQKIFRIENVEFESTRHNTPIDYASLSDGEHQFAQIIGTLCMVSQKNTLFLLDEPESHFNPKWRVEFVSKLLGMTTVNGSRVENSEAAKQECILTTHSPFVPSDMKKENVIIFQKDQDGVSTRRPDIETYGSTFDTILEECFRINPPMSSLSKDFIQKLLDSDDPDEISRGMQSLGDSVERLYLADRIRILRGQEGQ